MAMWYLAYGSNMDLERLRKRLGKGLLAQSYDDGVPVRLSGWYCCFDKRGADGTGKATLKPRLHAQFLPAEGILWPCTEPSLDALDNIEGVPLHYRREIWEVPTERGRLTAMVYLHQPSTDKPQAQPSREYVNFMLAGSPLLSAPYQAWLRALACVDDPASRAMTNGDDV